MNGGSSWTKVRMNNGNSFMPEGFFALALVGDRALLVGDDDLIAKSDRA